MPKNIEGYYQETGRAGRDGLASDAWMAYGLQDVVNQRRMIDESPAGEEFKQVMRGKLDALLGLAEATDCRRVRLLSYFGEAYKGQTDNTPGVYMPFCGNCDNCLNPPEVWDGTDAARKLLSTVYRTQQSSGHNFGAGHTMDIVRGKKTDKVAQRGHESISTFGLGAHYSEQQLRAVMRQLIAIGALHVHTEEGFSTLHLTEGSRAILKGDVPVQLRQSTQMHTSQRADKRTRSRSAPSPAAANLGQDAMVRYINLKAWRAEVAKEHNLPAYVIFHDATLAAIAESAPQSLGDLQGISGLGVKKLEAYGEQVLRVCKGAG
jgi:ATP-dependent DNA helicase RecQ